MQTDTRQYGTSTSSMSSVSDGNGIDYIIRPPTTGGDNGSPSSSLLKDLRRVLALIQDERHLVAHDLYCNVRERIDQGPQKVESPKRKGIHWNNRNAKERRAAKEARLNEFLKSKELFVSNKDVFDKLEVVARLFRKAEVELSDGGEWIYSQTLFGVATYYRRETDGSLSIKLDGSLNGVPLFEQVAVLREVDLHKKWVPFCTSSVAIKYFDKIDVVGWFVTGLPSFGLMRDGCFRAIGCDSIWEDGKVFLVGQGVADRSEEEDNRDPDERYLSEDPAIQDLDIPPVPSRMGSDRMTIQKFNAVIEILSPTSATTRLVANINPNLDFVPQSLIDYLMKKLCGVVISKLQTAASKCAKEPVKNAHARRMRHEAAFYDGWLLPKFQGFCEEKGWELPSVAALELSAVESQEALEYEAAKLRRGKSSNSSLLNLNSERSEAQSEPVFRTFGDEDSDVSELSGASSIWKNNPIAEYLREVERKAELRKEKGIAKARQRAADRLKRGKLSEQDQERLKELKQLKRRRLDQSSTRGGSGEGADVARTSTLWKWTRKLHSHGKYTRFVVVGCIFIAMMALLQAPSLSSRLTASSDGWWLSLLRGFGTLLYLAICASVHFVLCDVSFVYAFESLDLGMKTGRRTKQYYSTMIHLLVAATSFGIVAGSTVKALVVAGLREAYWYSLILNNYVQEVVQPVADLFYAEAVGELQSMTVVVVGWFGKVAGYMGSSVASVGSLTARVSGFFLQSFNSLFVRSHWIGRASENAMYWSFTRMFPISAIWNDFTSSTIASHEGTLVLPSWRSNAIDMSKVLLMHTAVFIVTILFLFNATISHPKTATKKPDEVGNETAANQLRSDLPSPSFTDTTETQSTESPLQPAWRQRVVNRWGPSSPSSGGSDLRHETIQEESEAEATDTATAVSEMPNPVMTPTFSSKKKRRGLKKLRLRKGGSRKTHDEAMSMVASESGSYRELQHAQTY